MAKSDNPENLQQLNISLPTPLLAFVQRRAKLEDRTLSGQIRHYVSEAARQEPPPAPSPFGTPIPNVAANAEAIAEAKALIAKLRSRQVRLANLRGDATAASDMELQRVKFEAEILEERVEQAERLLPRPTNGA